MRTLTDILCVELNSRVIDVSPLPSLGAKWRDQSD